MMSPNIVTAKQSRMLILLAEEQVIAQHVYERRSHRENARTLRERAVRARLRYRSFFRSITGWYRFPEITP